jgi:hypothetical protein
MGVHALSKGNTLKGACYRACIFVTFPKYMFLFTPKYANTEECSCYVTLAILFLSLRYTLQYTYIYIRHTPLCKTTNTTTMQRSIISAHNASLSSTYTQYFQTTHDMGKQSFRLKNLNQCNRHHDVLPNYENI